MNKADIVSCLDFYQYTLSGYRCANNNASWYGFKMQVFEMHKEVDADHFNRHCKKRKNQEKI